MTSAARPASRPRRGGNRHGPHGLFSGGAGSPRRDAVRAARICTTARRRPRAPYRPGRRGGVQPAAGPAAAAGRAALADGPGHGAPLRAGPPAGAVLRTGSAARPAGAAAAGLVRRRGRAHHPAPPAEPSDQRQPPRRRPRRRQPAGRPTRLDGRPPLRDRSDAALRIRFRRPRLSVPGGPGDRLDDGLRRPSRAEEPPGLEPPRFGLHQPRPTPGRCGS